MSTTHAADIDAPARRGLRGANIQREATAERRGQLGQAVEQGLLTPTEVRTCALEEAAAALDHLEDGHVRGKLLLVAGAR